MEPFRCLLQKIVEGEGFLRKGRHTPQDIQICPLFYRLGNSFGEQNGIIEISFGA